MIAALYAVYSAAIPWVVPIAMVWALFKRDWNLLRCVALVAAGQVAVDAWAYANAAEVWRGQPYWLYLIIYTLSAIGASIRPSGKLCSTMGGIFVAGTAFSIMALAFKYTPDRDMMFWQTNVILGALQLVVIMGGATGERGRRFCIALGRGFARVANRAVESRLA